MKRKRLIFLISIGLIVPNLGSCSAPSIVDKIIVDGKDKIQIGETTSFKADIYPTPKTKQTINWTTSNSNVAYVDKDGNVTGTSKGKATITAKVDRAETKHDVFIGGYIENHVSNISISGISDLKVGDYKLLNVTVNPENATNKEIAWTSSDSRIASVNKDGLIKGEFAGEATITATSKENNQIVDKVTIKVDERDPSKKVTIKSFAEPNCLIHYKEKINHLEDKIDQTKINRDNSKQYINNNFFKYDDNEKDKQIYKVGTDNPFRFKCNITTTNGDDPFKEIHDSNPYQTFELYKKSGEEYGGNIASQYTSYKGNEIQFKKEDAGSYFKLVVKPDTSKYKNITSTMTATIEFKVIEGYNAYDFAGLTTIDNWTEENAKKVFEESKEEMSVIEKGEFVDVWKDYKAKQNIPHNVRATILHDNISIDYNLLPDSIVWTEHEVSDYINGVKFPESKDNFNSFVEIKKSIHQDEWSDLPDNVIRSKCINFLYKSLKDYVYIFNRTDYKTTNTFTLEGNYFLIDCSSIKPVCLFDSKPLCYYQQANDVSTRSAVIGTGACQGNVTHSKTTSAGEYVYDLFRPFYGNNRKTENLITINNLNSFGNSIKSGTHDESLGAVSFMNSPNTQINNSIIHGFSTILIISWSVEIYNNISKCKLFDAYANLIFSSTSYININDSILKDADGGCIKIVGSPNFNDTKIWSKNSYYESFISGNEPFNQSKITTLLYRIIGKLGNECIEKYKNIKFGKDGKYAPTKPQNFIKIENDIVYINSIITHSIPTNVLEKTSNSKFIVDGVPVYNVPEDYGTKGHLRDYLNSFSLLSCCLESVGEQKDKGHAKLPLLDIISCDDLVTFSNDGIQIQLSDYIENKNNYDNNSPEIGANFGRLFCNNYLTVMFDFVESRHFTIVLGYK